MRDLSLYGGPNFDDGAWWKGRHWVRRMLKDETPYKSNGDAGNGCFDVRLHNKVRLHVIASNGGGWDHVSVSHKNRIPKWDEMCCVKALFFNADETVIQYHPSDETHINIHPFCLHLWRPQTEKLPVPPTILV